MQSEASDGGKIKIELLSEGSDGRKIKIELLSEGSDNLSLKSKQQKIPIY